MPKRWTCQQYQKSGSRTAFLFIKLFPLLPEPDFFGAVEQNWSQNYFLTSFVRDSFATPYSSPREPSSWLTYILDMCNVKYLTKSWGILHYMCRRWDLNLHTLRYTILSRARLPFAGRKLASFRHLRSRAVSTTPTFCAERESVTKSLPPCGRQRWFSDTHSILTQSAQALCLCNVTVYFKTQTWKSVF